MRQARGEPFPSPASGKGTVARAVLYFLLRYPKFVASEPEEFEAERVATLLAWHTTDRVGDYERHRNQAIFELQGNRNPLIDHPELAERIDLRLGLDLATRTSALGTSVRCSPLADLGLLGGRAGWRI